jgi:hypothetical protein
LRVEGHRFGGAYKKKRDVAREVRNPQRKRRDEREARENTFCSRQRCVNRALREKERSLNRALLEP